MSLRRYSELKQSRGTVIPATVRNEVYARDKGCVGPKVGMPGDCQYMLELDHVRASGGMGMKSPSQASNLVPLCARHHQLKTNNGREWRPRLIAYIESKEGDTE